MAQLVISDQSYSAPGRKYKISSGDVDLNLIPTKKIISSDGDPHVVISPDGSVPTDDSLQGVLISGSDGTRLIFKSDYATYEGGILWRDNADILGNDIGMIGFSRGAYGQDPLKSEMRFVLDNSLGIQLEENAGDCDVRIPHTVYLDNPPNDEISCSTLGWDQNTGAMIYRSDTVPVRDSYAYLTANQSIASGADTIVNFSTVTGMGVYLDYDNGSGEFVALVKCQVSITFQAAWGAGFNATRAIFIKPDTSTSRRVVQLVVGGNIIQSASWTGIMNAGQIFTMNVFHSSIGNVDLVGNVADPDNFTQVIMSAIKLNT
jgi:hypothetical protein